MPNVRAIALYLPQFHPIPENDLWWGRGFTEWTNTAKARPMFRGHQQPHVPADLGFYDLRVSESRVAQAELAASFGIEGFCYYHYWFAGRRVLERPLAEVVESGTPDFPFCVSWANETWSGVWHGAPKTVLIEQTYPGEDDHRAHFAALLPMFRDRRYIRVDGKPMFVIHQPRNLPEPEATLALWRRMAAEAGLGGLHLVATAADSRHDMVALGYDAVMQVPGFKQRPWIGPDRPVAWARQKLNHLRGVPHVYGAADLAARHRVDAAAATDYPCVVHAWDNTPRSGRNGVVYQGTTPDTFRALLTRAAASVAGRPADRRIVFLKSWNEWAEGNHLEPDLRHGLSFLQVVSDVVGGPATP